MFCDECKAEIWEVRTYIGLHGGMETVVIVTGTVTWSETERTCGGCGKEIWICLSLLVDH